MSEEKVYKAEEAAKLSGQSSLPAMALIGLGIALFLAYLFDIRLIELLWPGFIIGPGLLLMWPAYKSTANDQSKLAFLAVPGAMIVTLGVLLFTANISNHYELMAYSWPLVIAAAAAGVMYVSRYDDNEPLQQRGYKFIRAMSMIFIGMALFFEIIVWENFNPFMSIGLIVFGLYLLLRDRRALKRA